MKPRTFVCQLSIGHRLQTPPKYAAAGLHLTTLMASRLPAPLSVRGIPPLLSTFISDVLAGDHPFRYVVAVRPAWAVAHRAGVPGSSRLHHLCRCVQGAAVKDAKRILIFRICPPPRFPQGVAPSPYPRPPGPGHAIASAPKYERLTAKGLAIAIREVLGPPLHWGWDSSASVSKPFPPQRAQPFQPSRDNRGEGLGPGSRASH